MYKAPPSIPARIAFGIGAGALCGGAVAAGTAMAGETQDLALSFGIGIGFGSIWGGMWSLTTIPVLEGGDLRHASLAALLPSIGVSVALGAFLVNPLISLVVMTTLFEVLCAQSSRRVRAWRDREPWRCAQCLYDLRGVTGRVCPECGRTRDH